MVKYNKRSVQRIDLSEIQIKESLFKKSEKPLILNGFLGNSNISYKFFELGIEWFNLGKALEEIDTLDKNDEFYIKLQDKFFKYSFEVGFNFAKRKKMIFDLEVQRGKDFYNNNGEINLLDKEKRSKLSDGFIFGYEWAKNNSSNDEKENNTGLRR